MDSLRIAALALLAAGVLALVYGNFSYTREAHAAIVGSPEVLAQDRQAVNIPMWAGIAAIVAGAGLMAGRRS